MFLIICSAILAFVVLACLAWIISKFDKWYMKDYVNPLEDGQG